MTSAGARLRVRRIACVAAVVLAVAVGVWAAMRFTSDRPVLHESAESHFKYGSLGGERGSGIPRSVWNLLPELFAEELPAGGGAGLRPLGFLYEEGRDLPIGVSQRKVQGIDRVFLNCAVCHAGTVRDAPSSPPRVVLGMPANTVDLQGFQRFLSKAALDERFTGDRIADELDARDAEDFVNSRLLRHIGVALMRDRLLMLGQRFAFTARQPDHGPGRVDTFNPPKVLLNFRMDNLPEEEWVGTCDFPSVWNQRKRQGMWLHWDGNNDSVAERNRSAAFGAGATPPTLDRAALKRVEDWLLDAAPPPFPYPVDRALADRGAALYAERCASCHGRTGSDFAGKWVGQVTPIAAIGTDRWRLDSYSEALCANQNLLYAGYDGERFTRFRKTWGYANQPLDGIWLRAPYLHNGSVPTLRDLLEPAASRPATFYRGYDVYDAKRVGFVSDVAAEGARKFFLFDTRKRGNGNGGHEGEEYGTTLPPEDKDAIVEHLKTF